MVVVWSGLYAVDMDQYELDPKVQRILESNGSLQSHYNFLLNKKKLTDKALEEFINKVKDDDSIEFNEISPALIDNYDKAVEYVTDVIMKDEKKVEEIKKYITQQDDMEKVWKLTKQRLSGDPTNDEGVMNTFYNECMKQLEEFSKKCHYKFQMMEIPLFCLEKDKYYKNLSKDRKQLIAFIQDQVMKGN